MKPEDKTQLFSKAGKHSDAELVKLLTDQLKEERAQRISNLKNAVSILRVCTMSLETALRRATDSEQFKDTESMLGIILTMRGIMEDEITLEIAKANAVNSIGGKEAVH